MQSLRLALSRLLLTLRHQGDGRGDRMLAHYLVSGRRTAATAGNRATFQVESDLVLMAASHPGRDAIVLPCQLVDALCLGQQHAFDKGRLTGQRHYLLDVDEGNG